MYYAGAGAICFYLYSNLAGCGVLLANGYQHPGAGTLSANSRFARFIAHIHPVTENILIQG